MNELHDSYAFIPRAPGMRGLGLFITVLDKGLLAVSMRKLQVVKVDEPVKIPREVRERLRDLGIARRVSFMKRERVPCPLTGEEIAPLNCFACEHFLRRVKGFVHCNASRQ